MPSRPDMPERRFCQVHKHETKRKELTAEPGEPTGKSE